MTTPHKWAEVIIAWAQGKEIEYKNTSGVCIWLKADNEAYIMPWNDKLGDHIIWRVKPEAKTGWINIYRQYPDGWQERVNGYITSTKKEADLIAIEGRLACIQITYTEGEGL